MAKLSFIETLLSIVLLCFCACTDSIVMDPVERIVYVNSVLSDSSVQTVNLSYSSYVSESVYPKVKEAEVKMHFSVDTTIITYVYDGEKIIEVPAKIDTSGTIEFIKVEDGVWQANFTPIGFAHYRLRIDIPEYGQINATTQYPPKVSIKGELPPHLINSTAKSETSTAQPIVWDYNGSIAFSLISGIKNHKSNLWIYGRDYNPDTKSYNIANYIYTNHYYTDDFNRTTVNKSDIKEFEYPDDIYETELADPNDPYYTPSPGGNASYYTPGYYLFLWSLDYIPHQVILPIDNHYCRRIIFPAWTNDNNYCFWDKYLRIEHPGDETAIADDYHLREDGKKEHAFHFVIGINFKPYKYYVPHPLSHLVFQFMSKELDRYYKDLLIYTGSMTELSSLYEYERVYSNIENGRGIFGAAQIEKVTWGISQHYYESYIASQSEVHSR